MTFSFRIWRSFLVGDEHDGILWGGNITIIPLFFFYLWIPLETLWEMEQSTQNCLGWLSYFGALLVIFANGVFCHHGLQQQILASILQWLLGFCANPQHTKSTSRQIARKSLKVLRLLWLWKRVENKGFFFPMDWNWPTILMFFCWLAHQPRNLLLKGTFSGLNVSNDWWALSSRFCSEHVKIIFLPGRIFEKMRHASKELELLKYWLEEPTKRMTGRFWM